MDWEAVCNHITRVTDTSITFVKAVGAVGGDINQACIVHTSAKSYFVKSNRPELLDMFDAEADGLRELAQAAAVRVPLPVCTGCTPDRAYIVMQHIPLHGLDANSSARLGEQLAIQHRVTSDHFGWRRDNTIGANRQINTLNKDWISFFKTNRLGFQLDLAKTNGGPAKLIDKGAQLLDSIEHFFTDYQPVPSLLHGDLWRGNAAADNDGTPVIFDPAMHYGDREADLAMTELFGGFPGSFYSAYQNAWPLDAGYTSRKQLYNLYHILNHFNLFGTSYAVQASNMIDHLLSEIR